MNRRSVVLMLALAFMLISPQSSAARSPADGIVGDGDRLIDWSESVQGDGFRYLVGYREGRGSTIVPILIQNTSKQDMVNARMRVTWNDPENSDTRSVDESAWVYPAVIGPGDFGFIGGKPAVGSFPEAEFGELKVYRITSEDPEMESRRVLDILNLDVSETGRVEADIRNSTDEPVEDLVIHWVCVEQSGLVIIYDFDSLDDIRRLNAGADESISIRVDEECVEGLLITAHGRAV